MICLELWTEKKTALGEDAPPTLETADDQTALMAVYDGLGGAGSTLYGVGEQGKFSGAYLGARCAKAVVENFYRLWDNAGEQTFAAGLEEALKFSFIEYVKELQVPISRLKSKLLKTLPTTLAGILVEEKHLPFLKATAFWAGDSRCYMLEKDGLCQLSTDDLNGSPDALENLSLDATITNCIHAEGKFSIDYLPLLINLPVMFLVATDGCFGYVETPIHFEYILLKTLMESHQDTEDWTQRLTEQLLAITGDDMSLALMAWGFENLEDIKRHYYPRYVWLKEKFIAVWEHHKQQPAHEENTEMRETLRQHLWDKYKTDYYGYA